VAGIGRPWIEGPEVPNGCRTKVADLFAKCGQGNPRHVRGSLHGGSDPLSLECRAWCGSPQAIEGTRVRVFSREITCRLGEDEESVEINGAVD